MKTERACQKAKTKLATYSMMTAVSTNMLALEYLNVKLMIYDDKNPNIHRSKTTACGYTQLL